MGNNNRNVKEMTNFLKTSLPWKTILKTDKTSFVCVIIRRKASIDTKDVNLILTIVPFFIATQCKI